MRFNILGPLEVFDPSGEPLPISGPKERTLLAVLLVNRGDVVSVDRLMEALWPSDPPSKPANALQARMSVLRRVLGDGEVIVTRTPGYCLAVGPEALDTHQFESRLARARQQARRDPESAVDLYDEALEVWRGPVLAEFRYEDFAQQETSRLEELRVTAREERIQVMLEAGRHMDVVGELEGLVGEFPLREKLWAQLMLALYRSGRQAESLRAFQEARRILGEELGIEPSEELRRLEEAVLMQDSALDATERRTEPPHHNLPVRLTSLVGREADIERVVGLLDDHRVVTLVGPGGVGKTSLGLACGHNVMPRFPDGVWLADLSPLHEPGQVPLELARSLDLEPGDRSALDAVAEHLRDRRALIILDNCEHLLDSVAETAASLLQRAPGVDLLTTSREPLGIPGEILWPTRPLSIPEEDSEGSFEYDAVRLFVDRARAVDPDFVLEEDTGPAVGEICRRLDGLPLAVELAAARMRSLPVAEIARRLEDRFRILTGGGRTVVPRQQTLEATIAWSYDSLSEEERSLFRHLSVFVGGWSLEAAEAVGSEPDAVLDLLARLVDRSLVNVATGDVARYSMLETIRAFASRALAESGEQEEASRRHAQWFLKLAESAELQGNAQSEWISRLSSDHENLRAAIGYASRYGNHQTALRLGAALGWWWFFGNREEGRTILDELLAGTEQDLGSDRVPVLQARALLDFFGASTRSFEVAEEALTAADAQGDPSAAAMSKVFVSLTGVFGTSVDRSLELLDEAIAIFAADRDPFAEGLARFQRMEVLGNCGSLRNALQEGETALRFLKEAGDPWAVSVTFGHLGRYGRLTGQLERAEEATRTSIEMAQERSLPHTLQYSLTDQGYLAYLRGDLDGALRFFEEAMSVAGEAGNRMGTGTIRNGMAEVLLAGESIEDARRLHLEAAEEFSDLELDKWRAYSLTRLGLVEECAGNWRKAGDCHAEAYRAMSRLPGSIGVTLSMEGLGRVAAAEGDLERSARLLHAGKELRRRGGLAPTPPEDWATDSTERILRDAVSLQRLKSMASELEKLGTPQIAAVAG